MSDREEFVHRLREVSLAIDQVLLAAHALQHDLAAHHAQKGEPMPPFEFNSGELTRDEKRETALMGAMKHYGPTSPMTHLWIVCRALDGLRTAWTGKEVSRPPEAPKAAPAPLQERPEIRLEIIGGVIPQ